MNITPDLIADRLDIEPVVMRRNDKVSSKASWMQVIEYDPAVTFEQEFILFGVGNSFAASTKNRGIIAIGTPSEQVCKNNEVLVLPDECEAASVFRDIQRIVLRLNLWEADLIKILRAHSGDTGQNTLDALFKRTGSILENSMFFHDENFYLLGNSEQDGILGRTRWEYDETRGGYTLPIEILNEFKVSEEYQKTMHTHGPCIFSADMFGYRIMYQNIWDGDRYRGRICINELNREFLESDFLLLDRVASLVQESFQQRESLSYRQMHSIASLVASMIGQEPVPEARVSEVLAQYGWKLDDSLFCACLFPEERDVNTHTLQYYCTMLTGRFAHSCALHDDANIIVLVNHERSGISTADFRREIGIILRDGLIKAGISRIVPGFSDVHTAYRQAVCAYETGKARQPELWCFNFEDICVDYLMAQMMKEFPARHLCSPDLYALKDYDLTHTSELYLTFCTYLKNDRNLSRTAQLLGIHRSTLLFRMRKIGEIIGADLENYDDRFYLQLSMQLIDEYGI